MDSDTKAACADLVQAWGFARDQGRWDDLRATFHPGGTMAGSWFRGTHEAFVERCRHNYTIGIQAKHLLWPAQVKINGLRATTETNVAILVRQTIGGVVTDLTSQARFLDRMEHRDGVGWRMIERAAIYEKDRLDPVGPRAAFDALMAGAAAEKYPAPYRYMAYRVYAAGRALAEPVHYDGRPETEALKQAYAQWLADA